MIHRYPHSTKSPEWQPSKKKSVGIPAIWEALRHMGKYMDVPDVIKASLRMNQKSGFDCPGCAWPDPDDERSSLGEYCENGIKALADEASNKKADPEFFKKYSVAELSQWNEFELGKSGRLTHPMHLPEGAAHYQPISWGEAFEIIGRHLKGLDHPDEAIFYTSGRTSNEAAFMYGTFARAYGTNNLPDCSNMCHECSGYGLTKTLGIGKGAVNLEDIHQSDLIIVIGQNPGTNHPRMLTALEKCKSNGGKIISINPLKEAGLIHYTNPQSPLKLLRGGVSLSDLYLQVRINGDIPLLKAIMYLLWQRDQKGHDIIDHAFIRQYTEGFDAFEEALQLINLESCIEQSGVSGNLIERATDMICASPKMIICWAMGITQHKNGVENVQEIVNLLLMRGAVGKKGPDHVLSGDIAMYKEIAQWAFGKKMPKAFLDKLGTSFAFTPPDKHGLATVPAIEAMFEGKAKVFIGMGGNFVSATPDTDFTAAALRKCNLTVHVSTKPNRSHLVHGREALILPTLGRSEIDLQDSGYQFVSVENSMGIVHNSKGVLTPKSESLKSEVAIVAGMASAALADRTDVPIDWEYYVEDYDRIRGKIEEVIPGFENYNVRVREGKGFYLPNDVKVRKFNTASGKAIFTVNELPDLTIDADVFLLTTLRSHDQYNTTLYGLGDRYRGIVRGREVIFMNAQDMLLLELKSGDLVDVEAVSNDRSRIIKNFTVIEYDIPGKCIAAYFPEAIH